jgi:hypothetical protein
MFNPLNSSFMSLVFYSSLTQGAKTLADSLKVSTTLFEINESIDLGVKDIYCLIVTKLNMHIQHTEGMESVCYDDISQVATRLKIMVEHPS